MRFIQSWSYACANYLACQLKENHEKRRVYYFGFQVLIGAIVKGTLLIFMAFILRSLIPALIITLVFGSLRMIAGGYHMNTYGKCIFVSLGLLVTAAVIAQHTYAYWPVEYLAVISLLASVLGFYVILKWAPSDTPNRPINKSGEKRKFKALSMVYLLVWMVLVSLLIYFKAGNFKMHVLSACFGLLIELFTVSPFGYNFFERLSGKMDKIVG